MSWMMSRRLAYRRPSRIKHFALSNKAESIRRKTSVFPASSQLNLELPEPPVFLSDILSDEKNSSGKRFKV